MAKPTIEVAGKIAKILGVSLDYLVGNSDRELDSNTLKRILEVQNLPEDIKKKFITSLMSPSKILKLDRRILKIQGV